MGEGFTRSPVIEHYRQRGYHVLAVQQDKVQFLCGHGRSKPAKLLLDWEL